MDHSVSSQRTVVPRLLGHIHLVSGFRNSVKRALQPRVHLSKIGSQRVDPVAHQPGVAAPRDASRPVPAPDIICW